MTRAWTGWGAALLRGRGGRETSGSGEQEGSADADSPRAALTGSAEGDEEAAGSREGEPSPQDDEFEDAGRERARRGRRRLLLAAALFATLVLPKVVSTAGTVDGSAPPPASSPDVHTAAPSPADPGEPDARPSVPLSPPGPHSPTASEPASGPPGSGPPRSPRSTALPPGTDAGFEGVGAGDCLNVRAEAADWAESSPRRAKVRCSAEDARIRVAEVRERGECPEGDGLAEWVAPGGRGPAFCLERRFRAGDCLLASDGGESLRAALMSAPACGSRPAGDFDRLLRVVGVHGDPPARIPQGFCAEGPGDDRQYWTWRVARGEKVICTVDAR